MDRLETDRKFDGLTLRNGHETLAHFAGAGTSMSNSRISPARCEISRTGNTNGPLTCFLTTTQW